MRPFSYKRIIAYFIDIILVTSVATALTYFLPENKEYNKSMNEYTALVSDFANESIEQEEFFNRTTDLIYSINRNSVTVTIVTTVLTIFYFVVFAYFMNGQTLGKKLMNIKIVSNNKKKLTMNNYLIRGLIINSILMNIISVIIVLGLDKTSYLKVNDMLTYLYGIFMVLTFGMILFREDRRGLHDILARTKVINATGAVENGLDGELVLNEDSKIKDASIIGEEKLKKM
ncbi:MAG: RDD family protein [Bacilli bacterium]|nr:RDD family protein [Bacilli bacterium]